MTTPIENPYLDFLRTEVGPDPILGKIPQYKDTFATFFIDFTSGKTPVAWRNWLVLKYSWAIPNEEAIRLIAKYTPIVEMGAGTGYWASLLSQAGADVIAYDHLPPSGSSPTTNQHDYEHVPAIWHESEIPFFDVKFGQPPDLRRHRNRALLLCWPPYEEPLGELCLDYFKGEHFIYVGDFYRSCANKTFFSRLKAEFEVIEECAIPRWSGLKDSLTIWRRREQYTPGTPRNLP